MEKINYIRPLSLISFNLCIKERKSMLISFADDTSGMSANTLDDRISIQKDPSKLEIWAAMNKIFSKDNSKGISSNIKNQSHKDWYRSGLANYCL